MSVTYLGVVRAALLAAALVAMGSSAFAQSASQFDLVCSGPRKDRPDQSSHPYSQELRLDLDAMRWCQDECKAARPILKLTPDQIILIDTELEERGLHITSKDVIDRIAGTQSEFVSTISKITGLAPSLVYMDFQGACKTAPFRGFPQAKF